jgi:hypothetical protein
MLGRILKRIVGVPLWVLVGSIATDGKFCHLRETACQHLSFDTHKRGLEQLVPLFAPAEEIACRSKACIHRQCRVSYRLDSVKKIISRLCPILLHPFLNIGIKDHHAPHCAQDSGSDQPAFEIHPQRRSHEICCIIQHGSPGRFYRVGERSLLISGTYLLMPNWLAYRTLTSLRRNTRSHADFFCRDD